MDFKCIVRYDDGLEIKCTIPSKKLGENVDVWLTEIATDGLNFLQISEIKK